MISERIMFVWFLLLGSVFSTPADEFNELMSNGLGESSQKGDISNIVPSRYANALSRYHSIYLIIPDEDEWSELVKHNAGNRYFNLFNIHVVKGITARHLTFCIYDDEMREAAIALFRLFQNTFGVTFDKVREWAKKKINIEMYMYALRLESIYSHKINVNDLLPPFVWNPHYFVNGESLSKASLMAYDIGSNTETFAQISKRNSSMERDLIYVINANYSGWNTQNNGQKDLLNYFREDISLNSYNLGIHLLYPFWMPNEELQDENPRFAEYYFYVHQQLLARYNLERIHLIVKYNSTYNFDNWDYEPYLIYKNGLPFPTRSCDIGGESTKEAYLTTFAVIERACRGLMTVQYGKQFTFTKDSDTNNLAKLMKNALDDVNFDKILRSLVGYGVNANPTKGYNSAPSILHHPETSLKDPAYWYMIYCMVEFFASYKNTTKPLNISQYESKEFEIIGSDLPKLTTFFDYYQFPVNHALSNNIKNENDWLDFLEVRQRRLNHQKFSFKLTVNSKTGKNVIVRLYLGPQCKYHSCWNLYKSFIELGRFRYFLKPGVNVISWSPENSGRFSYNDYYNSVLQKSTPASKYSMFRFPGNLLIPRGLEKGMNLTLFAMITPSDAENAPKPDFYREDSIEVDSKPLGFPFHRQATDFKDTAFNYKFFNITVYHRHQPVDFRGYFSPHLY